MKKILLFLFLLTIFGKAMATHTKGGWMYYEYLGAGINDPSKLRYKIGLSFYTSCNNGVAEPSFFFSIFQGATPFAWNQDAEAIITSNNNIQNCTLVSCYPCLNFIPSICYWIRTYEVIVELTPSPNGYIAAKQRCCRVNGISNLQPPSDDIGETYSIKIPGVNQGVPNAHLNTSPQFIFNDTAIVCGNSAFSIDFKATDVNGDSLVYSFCNAFNGGSSSEPSPVTASNPPYQSIPYSSPFSGSQPLGNTVSIDPLTGIISGIAPAPGEYVLTVCVAEYRNGVRFSESRKELHLRIADCSPVVATLDPDYTTCGDLTLTFSNQTDNIAIQNWFWQFGDPATGALDSSLLQFPTHTFSQAGDYTIKLIVNRGLPCVDSTTQLLRVYPGFFPGFAPNAPFCVGQPVSFTDTTRTNHGVVNSWSWNFGVNASLADTSHLQNPTFTFTNPGTYTVKLISGNSKGCRDTAYRDVTVLPTPALSLLPNDTSYCSRDSIQLTATGTGTFSWSPATNIIGGTTPTPRVFPSIPTTYIVTINAQGCRNRDSVRLTPVNDVLNDIIANPTSICQEDTLTLTGTSNKTSNLSWQWSPVASVASPLSKVARAFPMTTTNYTLTTTWGANCKATKTITIPVSPLAVPNAGADSVFCFGQTPVQLSASGGTSYQWSPATGLSNPNIANPKASPAVTTKYAVSVGVNGCSRRKIDSVLVTVRQKPALALTNDTLICSVDTLQLNALGTGSVLWSPAININNVTSNTPLVSPDAPVTYYVRLTDAFNCFKDDSVFVDVKQVVTVDAGPDTSICRTEGFRLRTTSDALYYQWDPPDFLNNATIKNPVATPLNTITYTVTANIGKCESQSQVTIKVAPYPKPDIEPVEPVCIGFSTQLTATGGSIYSWTPATFLSNPSIANPVVRSPTQTTKYVVTVTDTLGCTKAFKDSIVVRVIPQLYVNAGPRDTTIVEGETIRLNGSGASTYLWTPSRWLSADNIARPLAAPEDSIRYILVGTDEFGCRGTDTINIMLYRLEADMYVPTAFTPNGDGDNDVIRPILLGMRSLSFFRVFNRFGEEVFYTTQKEKGWNGIYKGRPQDPGTFVWMAEGITFKGRKIVRKGFVVLIR